MYPSAYSPMMVPTYVPMRMVSMPRSDLPAHLITLGNEQSPVCRHFLDGRCERGSACKFSHDLTRGAPTERHRLIDVVRLVGVYALGTALGGRDAIADVLRDDCADRYIVRIVPAPCVPHPTIINQRVKMFELHIQERRGYSVRNPRPKRSLDEVMEEWDEALSGKRYLQLPKNGPPSGTEDAKSAVEPNTSESYLIGRSPSYGSVKLSLHAWAYLSTVYMCECFLDLLRRELVKLRFFDDVPTDTARHYDAFARAAHYVTSELMLPARYIEHATSPSTHRRICHHPESFIDVLRLAFPQLLVCRSFSTSERGPEVKLIAAGKGAQIEAFFDRVAEYVWIIEKRGIHARMHGLRTDSDSLFEKKVRRHWVPNIAALDDVPNHWRHEVHSIWRHVLYTQYVAFTCGVGNAACTPMEPPTRGPGTHGRHTHPRSRADDGTAAAAHRAARRHPHGAGQWEEWHAADANRESNPQDNPPDPKGGKGSSGEESEAIERQREQLLELMADSD